MTSRRGSRRGTPRFAPALRSSQGDIEITSAEYDELKRARDAVLTAIAVEQKFWLLVESYKAYEQALLEVALEKAVRGNFDWRVLQQDALGINLRLSSLLAAARLYLDHLRGCLGRVVSKKDRQIVIDRTCKEYDGRIGYRVMEAVRNVAQHVAFGVQGVSYPHVAQEEGRAIGVTPMLGIASLKKARIKPSILKELQKDDRNRAVTPLVRQYLEGLGGVHTTAREVMRAPVEGACATQRAWIDRGKALWPTPRQPAYLVSWGDEEVQVLSELPDYWEWFQRSNLTLSGLSRLYVSGQDPLKYHRDRRLG